MNLLNWMKGGSSGTPEENEAKSLVNRLYEDYKDLTYHKQWYINISMYVGDQWMVWNDQTNRLEKPDAPTWRVRVVDNQLQPLTRKELAKLTRSNHAWQAFGATGEQEDTNAARVATKFLDAKWKELEMESVRMQAFLWAVTCGTGIIKTWYDSTKGPKIMNTVTGNEQTIGDINAMACSPFSIVVDPTYTSFAVMPWAMHVEAMSIDKIQEIYGKEVTPQDSDDERNLYEKKLTTIALGGSQPHENKAGKANKTAIVKEYWERPSAKFPQGRLIVVASDTVLWNGPNPTPNGELPFVEFQHIRVPGRFWGTCALEAAIPHQKTINRILSQIVEIQNKTARPALLLPLGSGVQENQLTSAPGQIIKYNPINGLKPEWQQAPNIPRYMLDLLDRAMQSMMNQYGQHEVSQGQVPAGVRSGVGIRFLQESDDTLLGPTAHSIMNGWARLGKLWLGIAKQEYKEDRQLRFVGKNKVVETLDFAASDVTGSEDVEVIPASVLPESKSAKQDFLMNLYQLGAFTNPQTGQPDNDRFLKMMEMGASDELYDDASIDINNAELENRAFVRGEYETVHEWDNHILHLRQHDTYRKGINFQSMPDEIKAMFKRHIAMHQVVPTGEAVWDPLGYFDEEGYAQKIMQQQQMMMQQQEAMMAQQQQQMEMQGQQAQMQQEQHGQQQRHAEDMHSVRLAQMAQQMGQAQGAPQQQAAQMEAQASQAQADRDLKMAEIQSRERDSKRRARAQRFR